MNNTTVSQLFDEFRDDIPKQMRKENLPGLSVAITDADRILWEAGFGVAEKTHKQPVSARNRFCRRCRTKGEHG